MARGVFGLAESAGESIAATLRNQAGIRMRTTSVCSADDATDSETIWPHPARNTTADRIAEHRRLNRSHARLYAGGPLDNLPPSGYIFSDVAKTASVEIR